MLVSRRVAGVATAALFVSISGHYFLHPESWNEAPRVSAVSAFDVEYWDNRISAVGAQTAYDEFRGQLYENAATHEFAHKMGDLLYQREGENGARICDASFGYGCFHQFFARLFIDRGERAIADITKLCATVVPPHACFHGVGHGIAAYFRNSPREAVDACVGIATGGAKCARGVFMELFAPSLMSDMSRDTRGESIAKEYAVGSPCSAYTGHVFEGDCYFSLPHLWFSRGQDATSVVALCESVSLEYRTLCFRGIGVDMPGVLRYDEKSIIKTCLEIEEAMGRESCLAESLNTLDSLGKKSNSVKAVILHDKPN
jgi:hypothetical protein